MKLLLIGPQVDDINKAYNFSGVWSYYIARELRRRGVELQFDLQQRYRDDWLIDYYKGLDLNGIDHILALGGRYFTKIPKDCAAVLRRRCAGAVTQIYDGPLDSKLVNCTFTIKSDKGIPRNHYIGWAADPELTKPNQPAKELRILVDHPNLAPYRKDYTQRLVSEASLYERSLLWASKFTSVRIRCLTETGVADYADWGLQTGDDWGLTGEVHARPRIPYPEICKEYAQTHLFLVTHPESLGMTVLETAMAGALPLVPIGFVTEDRLETVRALAYPEKAVPLWSEALGMIDVDASRAKALENSWERVVDRMLSWFKEFKK